MRLWAVRGLGAAAAAAVGIGVVGGGKAWLGEERRGGLLAAVKTTPAVSTAEADEVLASNSFLPRRSGPRWDYNWDLREPASLLSRKQLRKVEETEGEAGVKRLLKENTAKASRHILLVRHGQYNLKGATDEERKLTDLGRAQAKETGKRLKTMGFIFDRVVHSTMTRATETAQIILGELESEKVKSVSADVMLEEGMPYPVEPPIPAIEKDIRVEEIMREGSRIEAAFREHFHRATPEQEKDSYELLVCHGNVTRYILCRALQFPPEAWLRFTKAHGSITHITIRPNGRVVLSSFADSGHFPTHLITYS